MIGSACDKINTHLTNNFWSRWNLDEDGTCQSNVQRRVGLALEAMHALLPIWRAKDFSNQTKIGLFMSLVLSIILCSAETWTPRKWDQDRLLSIEMSYLRIISDISKRNRISKCQLRQTLDLETTIMDRIHSRRLTDCGHAIWMYNNYKLPLMTLLGSTNGTRPKGHPPKRWVDCCKESCLTRGIASLTDVRLFIRDMHKWRTFSCSSHLERA